MFTLINKLPVPSNIVVVNKHSLDTGTQAIVDAAIKKHIPVIRLHAEYNLIQLGYGKHQRRIWSTQTDQTSAIAHGIAADKILATKLIEACGVITSTQDEELSNPISNGQLNAELPLGHSFLGTRHSLLVVGKKIVAVLRETILSEGSEGCFIASDHISDIHPDIVNQVMLAVRVVGLDIAGVEVRVDDISKPLSNQHFAILDVHAKPCINHYVHSSIGQASQIGELIVDELFPDQTVAHIPVIVVSGGQEQGLLVRILAFFYQQVGFYTSIAASDGVYCDAELMDTQRHTPFTRAQNILINPLTEVALIEQDFNSLLGEGLPYQRCNLSVMTGGIDISHQGTKFSGSEDQMTAILEAQMDVVLPNGHAVLNATDPRCLSIASRCDGEVVLYSIEGMLPVIEAHIQANGRACILKEGHVVIVDNQAERYLFRVDNLIYPDDVILAATAAAWALQFPVYEIENILEKFNQSSFYGS